ncbi:hypothetical protein BV20DRAFT_1116599 [Pilatotrama ljubarskyi]|nr:hypothetical protein BV20DRAFT_1116599 [Pilatotrama ljubarskyi]
MQEEEQDDEFDAEQEYEHDTDEDEDEHQHAEEDQQSSSSSAAEPPRPLGRFMTPQIARTTSLAKPGRLSLGGANLAGHDASQGARRVRVVEPWKVNEIQLPPASIKEEARGSVPPSSAHAAGAGMGPPTTPRSAAKREKLSEEEREAIRARRRSALATPDNFFKGQTPGSRRVLFAGLAPLPSPRFTQDASAAASTSAPASSATPPTSSADSSNPQPAAVKEETPVPPSSTTAHPKWEEEEDSKEDTAVLLARMRQLVAGAKQRQSLGRQSLALSPRKRDSLAGGGGFSLLASGYTPARVLIQEDDDDGESGMLQYPEEQERQDGDGDEDVEMHDDEREQQQQQQEARAAPKTPLMSDLRHVFGRAHAAGTSTPALAGVRDMFRPSQPQPRGSVEMPTMEGVKEMLGTPAAYRGRVESQERREAPTTRDARVEERRREEEYKEQEEEEEEEEPVEPLPTRGARGRKAVAPGTGASTGRIARRTPLAQSAPAKSTRASSQALEVEGGEEKQGQDARAGRRTRARTADGDVGVGQIPRATRGKAAEKKPATPEPPAEDEHDSEEPARAPATTGRSTRRTRQTTDSSASSAQADGDVDTKPARKTRAKTPTPAAKPRRGTRAKPIEVPEGDDGEDDELDSLPRDGPAYAADEEREAEPAAKPAAARVRRGTRSKIPVKQEDVEPSLAVAQEKEEGGEKETGKRTTRARRTPVPRHPTPSGTSGAGGRSGTRSRAAAAATPASAEAAIPEDKENTPESHEEEEESEQGEREEGEAAKKSKAGARVRAAGKTGGSRKTKASAAAETTEEIAMGTATTKTRAGRARAGRA